MRQRPATPDAARGRGTSLSPPNRFEPISLEVLPDHLEELAVEHPGGRQVATRVFADHARTIINRVDSPDMPFSWTINPYRGCEHGCIYCYARPTHENFGLNCGIDFETQVFAKTNAAELFRREIGRPSWNAEPIVISGVTDPYQPIERELRITRGVLEVAAAAWQPVALVTKNKMITRDLDLLGPMAARRCAKAAVSVTSLDNELSHRLEPRASAPAARLRAIEELAGAGVPVTVMVAPIIPGLNDREVPAILKAAADAGATGAAWVMLRLPWQIKDLFADWLGRHYPDRKEKVLSLVRSMRGGALYDATFGTRGRGEGEMAEQIGALFDLAVRRAGLDRGQPALTGEHFVRPDVGDPDQMKLFGPQ